MAKDGDIVFMIGADVAGLTRAGQSGERSLADMERAAKTLERQIGKIGESGVKFQREMNKLAGVSREVEKSARDSAAAFEAFDRSRQQVDNLRASIDPLFAASKRYEQALRTLDTALEQGTISARQHEQMVEQLAAAYLRADGAAETMGGGMGFLGGMSSQTQGKLQQVGFQIQDFAVQVGAGTSATQAFAQQFPQLAGAFGPVGVAAGTLAALMIPLGAAFLSAGEDAKAFDQALSDVNSALNDLSATAAIYSAEGLTQLREKYGELNGELLRHVELQRQMDLRAALESARDAAAALRGEMEGWINPLSGLQEIFPDIAGKVNLMYMALQDVEGARTFQEQVVALTELRNQILAATGGIEGMTTEQFAFYQKVQDSLDAVMQLNQQGAQAQGWLAAATAGAQQFAAALWNAAAGAQATRDATVAGPVSGGLARQGDDGRGGQRGTVAGANTRMPDQPWMNAGGGGGGGGGGANPIAAQIEQLRQQLMTEEQLELESFTRRQEMLKQALDQKLLTQQEYAALMEKSQQEHADKMSEIDVWRYGSGLDKAESFLGSMASALQGGNEKMLKISKAFGAAQALISAWQGAAEALKLPFPENLAAFKQVLATGMGAVRNIQSAKPGGTSSGGGGGAGAGGGAAQQPVQTLNFQFSNDPFGIGERIARQIAGGLNEAGRNGVSLRATVSAT